MPGFVLVPLDGGALVELQQGDTVLGRGPLLGISDKRVSRHHGVLENKQGRLRLKPTHVNPCFHQACDEETPQALEREHWHPLLPGDVFSLLPGRHVYKVEAVGGAEATQRNSQALQSLPASPEQDVEPARLIGQDQAPPPPVDQTPPSLRGQSCPLIGPDEEAPPSKAAGSLRQEATSSTASEEEKGAIVQSPKPQRRVLPAWMTAAPATGSPSSTCNEGAGRSKQPAAPAGGTKRGRPKPPKASVSSEREEEEEDEEPTAPRRKRKRSGKRSGGSSETLTNTPSQNQTARQRGPGVESEEEALEEEEQPREGEGQAAGNQDDRKYKDGRRDDRAGSDTGPAPSRPRPRATCPYGKDCYRKNPLHFQEASHPGDSDYEQEEEESIQEVDLPECPYGTDCYRKNPLHHKEYKHTKRPVRATRAAPNAAADDDDDEDDGDSFIDDSSDDAFDDEDYVPDEDDEDDVKRLQKEAKAFLRRAK